MKKAIILFVVFLTPTLFFGQKDSTAKADSIKLADSLKVPKYWKTDGSYNFAISRVNLQNWAGGGQSSLSFSSFFKYHVRYEKNKVSWDNSLDLGYGMARLGDNENLFKKSDDQLIILSKVNYAINKNWDFSALLDFRSQIANGFTYTADTTQPKGEKSTLISRFLAPGYLLSSVGFGYKKSDKFFAMISPATGKFTFVMEDNLSAQGAFGVTPGQNVRAEFGSLLKVGYKNEILKNVFLKSNLNLFSAYSTFGNIDVNWENVFQFKINEYLTTTFSTLLIYDDDIKIAVDRNGDGITDGKGPRIQYKDALNVGFLYKF